MGSQEIIDTLASLSLPELERVEAQLHELMSKRQSEGAQTWGEALMKLAGSASELPEDYAGNHDYYLHGAPRR